MRDMKMESHQKSVKKYQDYKVFLNDYFRLKKELNNQWSLGAWASYMGLQNTSTLSRVLNGERIIGPKLFEKLVRYFEMNEEEIEHFKNLIKRSKIERIINSDL